MEPPEVPRRLNILVVDDDANIRKTIAYCLEAEGHGVVSVSNGADAADQARRRVYDAAFVDLRLKEEDGLGLLPSLLDEAPWLKIVVITAYATIESAVDAMRRGAFDYVTKPFTPEQIRHIVGRIATIRKLEADNLSLREDLDRVEPEPRFVSLNASMQRALETARKAAGSEAVILLRGESGTGKSALARAIHGWSPRRGGPFGVVSCPAIPAELLESELFGHVRGAFTGAVQDAPGRIAVCGGGTLFLDEIADLAPAVQAKLLRFLQDRIFERVGDPTPRQADVRLIAATNADLEARIAGGTFREDLFYRINVISVTLPPLRNRPEDIVPIAEDLLKLVCRANNRVRLGFTDAALDVVRKCAWPGNVREMRNAIERAVILGTGTHIDRRDLPEELSRASVQPSPGDRISLAEMEELHIRRVTASAASLQEAADILGIDQATLWRRRQRYGI